MTSKKYDAIIVGAGLTGLTTAFYLMKSGISTAIIEKDLRVGGVIKTINKDGFIFETGPNTGVYSSAELVRLFDDLQGKATLEFANQKAKQRWIWKNGAWHSLPSGLGSAIKTPLFSTKDKFRILLEPIRKRGDDPYENVSGLVKRRMGESYLDYAVDPFISGVYAGDPDKLITQFALPKLYNLEQNYGSFIRGSIKKRREPKDELAKRATREVFSVKGGLQALTDALADSIGIKNTFLNCKDLTINEKNGEYLANFTIEDQEINIHAPKVITTIPANELKDRFSFIDNQKLKPITDLPYARVIEVIAAYKKWSGIPLEAFGGLIPSKEQRNALGILFTSSIFSGRTPVGGAILSVFIGGMRHPEMMELSDQEIHEIALEEISETLETGNKIPDHLEIFRYTHAIPQYDITSEKRFETIKELETNYKGLKLGGNIRDGIGMADRVKQGYELAQSVIHG